LTAVDAGDKPDTRELRNFGLLLGALFAAFFGVVPVLMGRAMHAWAWAVAAILWTAALLAPERIRYIHAGWTKVGLVLGWINTRVVLTAVFVIVVTPMGLLMRLFGRNRTRRRFEPELETYRTPSRPRPARSMERPF